MSADAGLLVTKLTAISRLCYVMLVFALIIAETLMLPWLKDISDLDHIKLWMWLIFICCVRSVNV